MRNNWELLTKIAPKHECFATKWLLVLYNFFQQAFKEMPGAIVDSSQISKSALQIKSASTEVIRMDDTEVSNSWTGNLNWE